MPLPGEKMQSIHSGEFRSEPRDSRFGKSIDSMGFMEGNVGKVFILLGLWGFALFSGSGFCVGYIWVGVRMSGFRLAGDRGNGVSCPVFPLEMRIFRPAMRRYFAGFGGFWTARRLQGPTSRCGAGVGRAIGHWTAIRKSPVRFIVCVAEPFLRGEPQCVSDIGIRYHVPRLPLSWAEEH
jgi:hypothetical protein